MTEEFDPTEARRLWRQAAPGQPAKTVSVSALELAAWLDGKADPALAVRVELALAADDGLLDMALAARAAAASSEPAPERLLARARAMVEHKVAQPKRGGFLGQFGSWRRSLEWAAVGACFLIAASGGFWMGDSLVDDVSAAQPAAYTLLGIDEESADLFGGEI
ncbi:MAG: hypothetical protein K0S54_2246 [Alphaproteobacteria bacterium]|jgi:hypothetical protein|nr:hypothetical protein [Alphaproteobacteria bacterium]